MSSTIGEALRLTLFGQSHGPAIGMTLEGLPAGLPVSMEALQAFLSRRAPGRSPLSTARQESDIPRFLSGLTAGVTDGSPLTAVIENTDARPESYAALRAVPRPGHADYTSYVKYGFIPSGGGHLSGRLTAALCVAGGICLQFLAREGITVLSRISSVGNMEDSGELTASTAEKAFPTVDDACGAAMQQAILQARSAGDSLGGIIQCRVAGLPAGVGDPIFGGLESRISAAVFGIPAVKGISFGSGFAGTRLPGSENNDPLIIENGKIVTETNHCGGILGGISTGMCIDFHVAVKPTPSISLPQMSVNLETMEPATLKISGRHDPCIVPRAVPCVEAAAAFAVCDALLGCRKERSHGLD